MNDEIKPGDNRLRGVDPENLLVIGVDEIAPLLDAQYPALVVRGDELLARALEWAKERTVAGQGVVIADDAAMNSASDLYSQLQSYAGATGEVEETRKKVGLKPRKALEAVNAWFATRRERLVGAATTIDRAQKMRLGTVRREAETERRRVVALAEQRAAEALAAAKVAAATAAPEVAEEALAVAVEAENAVAAAQDEATASIQDTTRTRSALGVTTSGSEKWDFIVEDFKLLCQAIGRGDVPITFALINESAIRAAIRGKHGMRSIAGLEIFPETKINRRGAK